MSTIHPGKVREMPYARTIRVRTPLPPPDPTELTQRELEVLRAVCAEGIMGAMERFCRERRTIRNTMTEIYRKLGLDPSRTKPKLGLACYQLGKYDERTGPRE
jgi:DNA-binding NarL/FixJ family response regulator